MNILDHIETIGQHKRRFRGNAWELEAPLEYFFGENSPELERYPFAEWRQSRNAVEFECPMLLYTRPVPGEGVELVEQAAGCAMPEFFRQFYQRFNKLFFLGPHGPYYFMSPAEIVRESQGFFSESCPRKSPWQYFRFCVYRFKDLEQYALWNPEPANRGRWRIVTDVCDRAESEAEAELPHQPEKWGPSMEEFIRDMFLTTEDYDHPSFVKVEA